MSYNKEHQVLKQILKDVPEKQIEELKLFITEARTVVAKPTIDDIVASILYKTELTTFTCKNIDTVFAILKTLYPYMFEEFTFNNSTVVPTCDVLSHLLFRLQLSNIMTEFDYVYTVNRNGLKLSYEKCKNQPNIAKCAKDFVLLVRRPQWQISELYSKVANH